MHFNNLKKLIMTAVLVIGLGVLFWFLSQHWTRHTINKLESEITSEILLGMKPSQVTGQLFHIGLQGKQTTHRMESMLKKICPGGIILFKRNLDDANQIKKFTKQLQKISNTNCHLPLLISIDQEGGRIQRIQTKSRLPSALSIGQTKKTEYAKYAAIITGMEMAQLGINLVLAPVLDINNNPENPVINTRSFGNTPEEVAQFGLAYTRGAMAIHSGPVIKHFPGHGDTNTDSHLFLPTIKHDLDRLLQTELVPFKRALAAGAQIVMVAHILFPALDEKYPATLSKKIITGLLRKKLGFQGLVMTDALEMKAIANRYKQKHVAKLALDAGADILLFADPAMKLMEEIHKELSASSLEQMDFGDTLAKSAQPYKKAARRQILYKLKQGLIKPGPDFPEILNAKILKYNEAMKFTSQSKNHLLPKKYANDFLALSHDICRDSITALPGQFIPVSKNRSMLFYKSKTVLKTAKELKIPKAHIRNGHMGALFSFLEKKLRSDSRNIPLENNSKNTHSKNNDKNDLPNKLNKIFVEIDQNNIQKWNQLVLKFKNISQVHITALYTGNPWISAILTDKSYSVVFNTTNGDICKPGLLSRAINENSDLIIPKSKLIQPGKGL